MATQLKDHLSLTWAVIYWSQQLVYHAIGILKIRVERTDAGHNLLTLVEAQADHGWRRDASADETKHMIIPKIILPIDINFY